MNPKLLFLLILYLVVVITLVSVTYYLLKNKRSENIKKRISNFTANKTNWHI